MTGAIRQKIEQSEFFQFWSIKNTVWSNVGSHRHTTTEDCTLRSRK